MERLHFDDIAYFICKADRTFKDLINDNAEISIIAKYENARNIICELICKGYNICSIDGLNYSEFDGYEDEFVISLANIIESNEIWCEPAKRKIGYYHIDDEVIYVLDECSREVFKHCHSKNIYEVSIGEDKDENDNSTSSTESVNVNRSKDDELQGFTKTWSNIDDRGIFSSASFSFYCDDIDIIKKIASELSVKL